MSILTRVNELKKRLVFFQISLDIVQSFCKKYLPGIHFSAIFRKYRYRICDHTKSHYLELDPLMFSLPRIKSQNLKSILLNGIRTVN